MNYKVILDFELPPVNSFSDAVRVKIFQWFGEESPLTNEEYFLVQLGYDISQNANMCCLTRLCSYPKNCYFMAFGYMRA